MKILITGGFGYLGGRIAQLLLNTEANQVLLGTRLPVESPSWAPRAKVVQTLWDSPSELKNICTGVDAVIHLAAMNAIECASDPVGALELNVVATTRLLRQAIAQGVKRFIYLSTAHVYRNPLTGVINEKTIPESLNMYAISHRTAEDVVRTAHAGGEIDAIVIRLSNAYGAPAHKDANCWMLLVNDLCRQAVTSQKMVLISTGLQRRDFVSITDVCSAIQHLLHLEIRNNANNIFNVGGAWAPTIWEVAVLIREGCIKRLGYEPVLTRIPPRKDEHIYDLDYRIDLLRETGFVPGSHKEAEIDALLGFCKASFC